MVCSWRNLAARLNLIRCLVNLLSCSWELSFWHKWNAEKRTSNVMNEGLKTGLCPDWNLKLLLFYENRETNLLILFPCFSICLFNQFSNLWHFFLPELLVPSLPSFSIHPTLLHFAQQSSSIFVILVFGPSLDPIHLFLLHWPSAFLLPLHSSLSFLYLMRRNLGKKGVAPWCERCQMSGSRSHWGLTAVSSFVCEWKSDRFTAGGSNQSAAVF